MVNRSVWLEQGGNGRQSGSAERRGVGGDQATQVIISHAGILLNPQTSRKSQ